MQAKVEFTSLPSRPPTDAKLIVIILGGQNEWDVARENVIVGPLFDSLSVLFLYISISWSTFRAVLRIAERESF